MAYYEDIIYDNNGKIKCDLCDVVIRVTNYCINLHLREKTHKDLYISRLMLQNNISFDANQMHCAICNISFQQNLQSHIESLYHQNKLEKIRDIVAKDGNFIEMPPNNTDNGAGCITCIICNIYIDFTLKGIENHITAILHKRSRAIILQYHNGFFSVQGNSNDLWCKICQIYLENYIEVIFNHVNEDHEHITDLKKIKGLINGQDIDIEKFLSGPTEDKAYCNKCQTGVSCNVDNLERHIKGKLHRQEKK